MVDIPEYVAKEQLDTDRRGMPQPVVMSGAGEGLQKLGSALMSLSSHLATRDSQKKSTEANYAFEDLKNAAREHEAQVIKDAPASGAGIHDNTVSFIDQKGEEILKGLDPEYQEEFKHRLKGLRTDFSLNSAKNEYEQSRGFHKNNIETMTGSKSAELAVNPEKWQEKRDELYKYIQDLPDMTAADRINFRQYVDEQLAMGKITGDTAQDPELAKSKLGFPTAVTPGRTLPIITGTQPGRRPIIMKGTNPELLNKWQQIQGTLGVQAPIVSANRPGALNKMAGGAVHSQHSHGNAIDIDVRGLSQQQKLGIIRSATAAGIGGIGVYENSIHIDLRKGKMVWGPSRRGPGKPQYNAPTWARDALSDHMNGKVAKGPFGGSAAAIPQTTPEEAINAGEIRIAQNTSPNAMSEATPAQLTLIANKEGLELKPYDDGGTLRIGFGSDTWTDRSGQVHRVTADTVITEEDAQRDLKRRVPEFTGVIKRQIGDAWNSLSEGAKTALPSVAYNYGSLPKTVVAAVKTGDNEAIAAAVEALPANKERRKYEAEIIRGNGEVAAYAPQGGSPQQTVDSAYSSLSISWRLQQLNRIEAEQKAQQKERAQEMRIVLDAAVEDSLASFQVNGYYEGQEPTPDMFLTAYPDDAYIRVRNYNRAKDTALTVHRIATMDVSEARAIRENYRRAIPAGQGAGTATRAYENISRAVAEREKDFWNRYEEISHRLKIRQDEESDLLEQGLKLRDERQAEIDKRVKKTIEQTVDEENKRRKEGHYREGTDAIEAGVKELEAQRDLYARRAVDNADKIIESIKNTGDPGKTLSEQPTKEDFERADPANGAQKYYEYQKKLWGAAAANKVLTADQQTLARTLEALYKHVGDKAQEEGEQIVVDAINMVMKERKDDPFGYANKHYDNVKTMWEKAGENPNNKAAQKAAIDLTMEVQRGWGMDTPALAILPRSITDPIVSHFKDPEAQVQAKKELLELIDSVDGHDAKTVVMSQLVREGVPEIVYPAVDAYVEGQTSRASIDRLFEAAAIKDVKRGQEEESKAEVSQTVRDAFDQAGGQTYYNTMVGGVNIGRYESAVELLTRAARIRMIRFGEDQDSAITAAMSDFFGTATPYDETTRQGVRVNIMTPPNVDETVLNRGFQRATDNMARVFQNKIDSKVISRRDVSDVVLPSTGLVEPGNINLDTRIVVPVPGQTDFITEKSFSRQDDDGREVLVPQVVNGKLLTQEEAWAHYKKTGEHLGKFDTPANADTYAKALHERQDRAYGPNFMATEEYRIGTGLMIDDYWRDAFWLEVDGGYGLYNTVASTFLVDDLTGQPFKFTKEQILNLGQSRPEDILEDILSGSGAH